MQSETDGEDRQQRQGSTRGREVGWHSLHSHATSATAGDALSTDFALLTEREPAASTDKHALSLSLALVNDWL
jgi:hypothetical protein